MPASWALYPDEPEQRDERGRRRLRGGREAGPHAALATPVAEHAHHVDHVAREVLDALVRVTAERRRRHRVGAGRAADAEIDPPGVERLEHRELLGDREWGVIGQHHTARSDSNVARWRRRGGRSGRPARCWQRSACCGARRPRSGRSRAARRPGPARVVSARASAEVPPSRTTARSSTDSATIAAHDTGVMSATWRIGNLGLWCAHGDPEGLRYRDRVRHRRARRREQPGLGLVAADQRLRQRHVAQDRVGLRGRDAGQRRPRVQPRRRVRAGGRDARSSTPCCTNGARYYVDHAHPEISTPEVHHRRRGRALGPRRRGDRASVDGLRRRSSCPTAPRWSSTRTTRTGRATSYGCHENYLMSRDTPFGRIASQITPHFVTRQVFCGAGQGRLRAVRSRAGRRAVPAQPAGRLLRGGGRAGDHAQAPDRQHPRRAALRSAEVPAPARDRR